MNSNENRPQGLRRSLARLTTVSLALVVAAGAATLPATAHAASPDALVRAASIQAIQDARVGGGQVGVTKVTPIGVAHPDVLPAEASLAQYRVPVINQGDYQSCVGWAIGYALMGLEARRAGFADPQFAAYYVYSQLNGGLNVPTSPSAAIQIVTTQGVDTLADYRPQGTSDFSTPPTAAQRANALPWRAIAAQAMFDGSYAGIAGADMIKQRISGGHPVAILLEDRPGLRALTPTANVDYDTTGAIKDRHEVLAIGYNATGLLIQNSWGTGWGSAGLGYLSWSVVQHDVLAAHSVGGLARGTATTTADVTGPTVSMPSSAPQLGSTLATSGVTKYLHSFTATDASGVASTLVDIQVDGGTWVPLTMPAAATTSFTYDLAPGHTYRLSVSAYDTKNNWSGWVSGSIFTVGTYNENYASYSTGWSALAWASSVNGAFEATATANATATFTFNGRGVAWVANKDTNRGQAWLYIDGVYQGVWDTYSATSKPRSIVMTQTWAANGQHTVKIVNVATAGRPNIDLDAMVVTY